MYSETGLKRGRVLLKGCDDEAGIEELAVPFEKTETASEALSDVAPVRVAANSLYRRVQTNCDTEGYHVRIKFISLVHAIHHD